MVFMRQEHFVVFKWLESLRKMHPLNHCQFAILGQVKKKTKTKQTKKQMFLVPARFTVLGPPLFFMTRHQKS